MKIDLFKKIVDYKNWLINRLIEGVIYSGWDDEFSRKNAKSAYDEFRELVINLDIDWNTLTIDQAKELGFKLFKDDLYVFPIWAYGAIKNGTMITDIMGDTFQFEYGKTDSDHRGECLAYGVKLSK